MNNPVVGMYQDTRKVSQPPNTYRYALNAIDETPAGDKQARSSEPGNTLCYELSKGHIPIGEIPLDNNTRVIFSFNPITSDSEISYVENCKRTTLINTKCLNFSLNSRVTGFFRLREGCKRTIYFRDDNNPPRIIDIDSLNNYRVNPADPTSDWDCLKFKWFRDMIIPQINLENVLDSGGQIPVGVVQFVVTYMDEDLNPSGYTSPTPPIAIIAESEGAEDREKQGGIQSELFGENKYTSKSIILNISNIDQSFKFIRLGALESYSATGRVTRAILKPPIEITGPNMIITYSGFNESTDIITTEEELTQERIVYDRVKDIGQIKNRALMAGVKKKNIDFTVFQNMANNIRVKWVSAIRLGREGKHTAKTPHHYFYEKSMPRDEVVALAIVPVFKDGTEGPAFHIPGRAKDTYYDKITQSDQPINPSVVAGYQPDVELSRRPYTEGVTKQTWDDADYDPNISGPYKGDYQHITTFDDNGRVRRWQAYNTAFTDEENTSINLNDINNSEWAYKGHMGYFETTTDYPNILDCNGNRIYPEGKIRHHRIPDSAISPHMGLSRVRKDDTLRGGIETLPQDYTKAYISHIGIELLNVKIPTQYKNEIQGWKLVMAEYTPDNRSVLDRGILFPNIIAETNDTTKRIQYQTSGFSRHRWASRSFPEGDLWVQHPCDAYDPKVGSYKLSTRGFYVDEFSELHKANLMPNDFLLQFPELYDKFTWASGLALPSWSKTDPTDMGRWCKSYSFHGVYTKFNSNEIGADYIKIELDLFGHVRWFESANDNNNPGGDNEGNGYATALPALAESPSVTGQDRKAKAWCTYKLFERPNQGWYDWNGNYRKQRDLFNNQINFYNTKINRQKSIKPDTISTPGTLTDPFVNVKGQETYVLETESYIPVNPKDQEWGVNYSSMANWMLPDPPVFYYYNDVNGASLNGQSTAHYVSLKKYNPNQFNNLSGLKYIYIDSIVHSGTSDIVWGGTTHVAPMAFRKTDYFASCGFSSGTNDVERRDGSGWFGMTFLVESEINTGLRHHGSLITGFDGLEGRNDCKYGQVEIFPEKFYFHHSDYNLPAPTIKTARHWGNIYDKDSKGTYLQLSYCHHNFYRYNIDFSKLNNSRYVIPLPIEFDWCNSCQYEQPLLIAYSESSFQEETTDNYRIFRPLNYKLIPGHTGNINNIFIKNDQLYINTTQSLWVQQVDPTTILSDQGNIYIGTGGFFSLPPKEIVSTIYGFAGCQHKATNIATQYGPVWFDANAEKVFLFSEQLKDISSEVMSTFFHNNTKLKLKDQLALLNITITEDSIINPNGCGFHAVYDPRYDRYILTKRDYELRDVSKLIHHNAIETSTPSGAITCIPTTLKWYVWNQSTQKLKEIFPTDLNYFNNYSWTISYSFKTDSWCSFHSYLPPFMYNDRINFYTSNGQYAGVQNKIYIHGSGYLSFHDNLRPFIIDIIHNPNPTITKIFTGFEYLSTVEKQSGEQFVDEELSTFSKVIFYNDTQCSGELFITPKTDPYTSLTYNPNNITADRGGHNRTWRIKGIRDKVNDRNNPIFTTDQTDILLQTQFPIDKVVNRAVLNQVDQYQLARFKDKYLGVRLIYTPVDNQHKITIDLSSTKQLQELR
ncbi:MAG: hypothetical protein KatS3mg002_1396 [Candidatus Woesearchaeota archaeon]|nr:MAG: hypothetical protein KatS3mg002_1396 [Candidatus Woesearchaeota archaeon]